MQRERILQRQENEQQQQIEQDTHAVEGAQINARQELPGT